MLSLIVALAVPLSVGFLSSMATGQDTTKGVYTDLKKPAWAPPAWVFGPVWTALYIGMGLAAWLVWSGRGNKWSGALTWFSVQLALNAIWSPIFFKAQNHTAALVVLVALLGALGKTTVEFWKVDRRAGMLLLPYLAWGAFAGTLNAAVAKLN